MESIHVMLIVCYLSNNMIKQFNTESLFYGYID